MWRKALTLYEDYVVRFPNPTPEYRRAMAIIYNNLGVRLATSGQ